MRYLALCLIAQTASAEIVFQDLSATLPTHAYTGGWEHFVGGGVAVFDCNGDSLPEIFAAGGADPAILLRNTGSMAFEKGALPEMTGVTGAWSLDADGDSHLDLMVLRVGENILLRGDGNCGFVRANDTMGFEGGAAWSTSFSATWADDKLVMAVGNYVDRDDPDGPFEACDDNVLHHWRGDAFERSVLAPGYCALSMLFARDASGQNRLRISNDRHYYIREGSEQMYDLSLGRFLGPDDGWDTVRLWGMGIASRDITGDGRSEVMLTSMGDQLMQIAGQDGLYVPAPYDLGTYAQRPHVGDDGRPSTGWHAEFGDLDNDGLSDLFIAKGNVDQMPGLAMQDPNTLLRQFPEGRFKEVSVAAGVATMERSRGAALADLDADGRLDLVVANRRAPLEMYRNITENTGNWIAIDLTAAAPNTHAIGAIVKVTANGSTQSQERTIGGGHGGGQSGPLHFGLGVARTVTIEVQWPDGTTRTATGNANQRLTLSP